MFVRFWNRFRGHVPFTGCGSMESGLQGLGVGFSECSPATALNPTVRLGTVIAFSSHRQQSP